MRVLVTGHDGYIGAVMTGVLERAGHHVVGLDSFLFADCPFGPGPQARPAIRMDLRDARAADLEGFDAVVHLAGISNDSVGELDPSSTNDINHLGSLRLAMMARKAGVSRFLFASSCSMYGAAGADDLLTEKAPVSPVTAYGTSKMLVERGVAQMADHNFTPTFLRSATVYGVSPRLRADLVVNNLVGYAYATGEIRVTSVGGAWRPLVHVEDVCRAYLAVMEAPRDLVHNQAFNVGRTTENYRVGEVAEIVATVVPGSRVIHAEDGAPDLRGYRVDFSKLATAFPDLRMRWDVRRGAEELFVAYRAQGFSLETFLARFTRLRHIQRLTEAGSIDPDLRWIERPVAVPAFSTNVS